MEIQNNKHNMKESIDKNWKRYLPSSHFVIIASGIAIILVLGFGIRFIVQKINKKNFVTQTGIETNVKVGDLLTKDSDGDGIPDWEEPLWGLDPKNRDTNGDGITDGEEVSAKKATLTPSSNEEGESLNETERLARDLFSTITALGQNGLLTDASVANIAATLGDQIIAKSVVDHFTMTDVTTIVANKQSISTYQKELSKIILKYSEQGIGTETEILANAFNANDKTQLEELKTVSEGYGSFAEDLSTLTVPADIAEDHLLLMNTSYKIAISLTEIQSVFDNPVIGLGGFALYTQESEVFLYISTKIHTYLQKNGIL